MQQFQDEAVTGPRVAASDSDRLVEFADRTAPSSLAAVIVGLRLRGYLSNHDRDVLEALAPPARQIFLAYCGRLLHPSGGTPFPTEHIAAEQIMGGDAVVTHRFSDPADHHRPLRIRTAVINPDDPDRITFGWFGTEPDPADNVPLDRYSEIVRRLRRVLADSAELTQRLRRQLDQPAPTLLLDRTTQRVTACNKAAAGMAARNQHAMVGLPFAPLRRFFTEPPGGLSTTMQQVSAADLELTVLTLTPRRTRQPLHTESEIGRTPPEARRGLAGIITAAELLARHPQGTTDEEVARLSSAIAAEARKLTETPHAVTGASGNLHQATVDHSRSDRAKREPVTPLMTELL